MSLPTTLQLLCKNINRSCLTSDGEVQNSSTVLYQTPKSGWATTNLPAHCCVIFLWCWATTCHVGRPRIVEVAQRMSLCRIGEAVPRSPVPALISQQMGLKNSFNLITYWPFLFFLLHYTFVTLPSLFTFLFVSKSKEIQSIVRYQR